MRFKYYFNNLSSRDKIFSFLLVPLILFFIFNFIDTHFLKDTHHKVKQQILAYTKSIKELKQSKHTTSNIKTIRHIEKLATTMNIKIINIKVDKSSFHIKTVGNYKNSIQFIVNLENNMKIKSLQILTSTDKQITINGIFKIYTNKINNNLVSIKDIPNPFISKKSIIKKNNSLKLIAIFNEEVCINNKWYKYGDKVGKYKLKGIFKNHIELASNNSTIKLKVYQDDK